MKGEECRMRSLIFRSTLIGTGILAVLILVGVWRFGSLSLAVAYIDGQTFVISPVEVDLGNCESGTRHIAVFTITNLTTRTIRVVGSEQQCSCLKLDELPIIVEPRKSQNISVQALVGGKEDEFSQPVILFLDKDKELESVGLHIRARVITPETKETATVGFSKCLRR
jgi:hypothetical protein